MYFYNKLGWIRPSIVQVDNQRQYNGGADDDVDENDVFTVGVFGKKL